jgi:hypothetical protein
MDLVVPHPRLWIPAGVLAVWFAIASARHMFGGWPGFLEALRYKFQPGWLSLARGEWWEDTKAEFKLFYWIMSSVLVALVLKIGLTKLVIAFALVERFRLPV